MAFVEALERRLMCAGVPRYPDLTPWVDKSRGYVHGWTIDTTTMPGRTLLRLSTAAINQGTGPMELNGGPVNTDGTQQVMQRVFSTDGTSRQFFCGNFIYHSAHAHIHFEEFAEYSLRNIAADGGVGTVASTGGKVSFCLLDSVAYNVSLPGAPLTAQNVSCSNAKQGISIGWADLYDKSLPGQTIDITDVPTGRYFLEVVLDPSNRIAEANERNNVARITIDVHQGDNTLATAYDVGTLSGGAAGAQTFNEFVGAADLNDYYKFTVTTGGTVDLSMSDLRANADLYLLNSAGTAIASSVRTGTSAETISRTLTPGTYYARAVPVSGDTTYTLSMSFTPTPAPSEPTTPLPTKPKKDRGPDWGGWHGSKHQAKTAAAEMFATTTTTEAGEQQENTLLA